jgi:tetratricopeptide (TPR) repeat protein
MRPGVVMISLAEAARILRVSPARLRALRRAELVSAAEDASAPLAFGDLVSLRAIAKLLGRGVSVRRLRASAERLRRLTGLERPLAALRVPADGSRRVLVRHGGALLEADGQLVFDFAGEGAAPIVLEPGAPEAPESALAWFERGCALDGEPSTLLEAVRAYERAVALDPAFADAFSNLGTAHYQRGDREPARRAYERALAADPLHLEANFNLANLLEEDGRKEAALHHYKVALRTDPTFADAHLNVALLYEKLGLRRHAREHWRRYLQLAPNGRWAENARERLARDPDA